MRYSPALLAVILLGSSLLAPAQVGYGEDVTGGAGGRTVTATTPDELRTFAASDEPLTIRIQGSLRIGSVALRSNKTIVGTGRRPSIVGALTIGRGVTNVIIRDLHISNPTSRKKGAEGFDGISINGGRRVWVDSCTISDCGDGAIDITEGADRITVSRCKFQYSSPNRPHRLVMLALGPPKKKSKGRLHLTLYLNWFAENCDARMPSATKARVHSFNNFFDSKGNNYVSNARRDAEILSENNVFLDVRNPLSAESGGKIQSNGDIFQNTSGRREVAKGGVFTPPYRYELAPAERVPAIVRAVAGCRL